LSPPRRRPHSSGRWVVGSGGPMRRRSARQLLSSAGSCRRTALSHSDQATPPPECCRLATPSSTRVWCADRLGAGGLSERLRRLAFAQSKLCRAVGPGKAGAGSPPGSRKTGPGGHHRSKTYPERARGVFAVWQYCQNQAVAQSGSALGMLIWCSLCSRHSSDRAIWYVHRTGRTRVAFINE
jgi:hypothetical protein